MSVILPDKVISIFLHHPVYERNGFRMWGRILEKYNLIEKGRDLQERLRSLHDQVGTHRDYMGRARRLFGEIHGITFNTLVNLFVIANSKCSRFGALADCL